MAKPFDATLNALIDAHVDDWVRFLAARAGTPVGPATVLDTDLSATLQADRLFRVDAAVPYAIHLELESTGWLGIPDQLLRYNVAARAAIGLPVHSVLVLLRPKANATDLTGVHEIVGADGRAYHTFRYAVVRVWHESVDVMLSAGLGMAPLAILTNEAAGDPGSAVIRVAEQMHQDGAAGKALGSMLESVRILTGLRYNAEQVAEFYRSVSMVRWEDSSTYVEIIERGRLTANRATILRLGNRRFGPPPSDVEAIVEGIADKDRLDRIADRLFDAADWADLLATE